MAQIVKRAKSKVAARGRRHERLRKKVTGTAERPRIVVNRSSRHVFVQLVDDTASRTLASASTMARRICGQFWMVLTNDRKWPSMVLPTNTK